MQATRGTARPEARCSLDAAIIRSGFAVVSVGGACSVPGCPGGDGHARWSYTVGLAERGLAEYVVTGLTETAAGHVLTWAAERALLGLALQPDEWTTFDGVDVRADPVPAEWLGWDRTRMAAWWSHMESERAPSVVQLVYADDRGRFPDEPECDPMVARHQPVLATDPTAFPPRRSRAQRRARS